MKSAAIEDARSEGSRDSLSEPSVDEVLYSLRGVPFRREDLRDFMQGEYNTENVDFWAQAEEYRQLFGSESQAPGVVRVSPAQPKSHQSLSKEIASRFIVAGSPQEINLSSSMREATLRKASEGDLNAFLESQQEVRKLISEDSLPRFLRRAANQNLTKSHARWRSRLGVKLLILGAIITGAIFALECTGILHTPYVRLCTWIIFVAGFAYMISGYQKVCSGLGMKGVRMRENQKYTWFDVFLRTSKEDRLQDPVALRRLRNRSRLQNFLALTFATILSVVILIIPVGANHWFD